MQNQIGKPHWFPKSLITNGWADSTGKVYLYDVRRADGQWVGSDQVFHKKYLHNQQAEDWYSRKEGPFIKLAQSIAGDPSRWISFHRQIRSSRSTITNFFCAANVINPERRRELKVEIIKSFLNLGYTRESVENELNLGGLGHRGNLGLGIEEYYPILMRLYQNHHWALIMARNHPIGFILPDKVSFHFGDAPEEMGFHVEERLRLIALPVTRDRMLLGYNPDAKAMPEGSLPTFIPEELVDVYNTILLHGAENFVIAGAELPSGYLKKLLVGDLMAQVSKRMERLLNLGNLPMDDPSR
jgi:hypothetical protein